MGLPMFNWSQADPTWQFLRTQISADKHRYDSATSVKICVLQGVRLEFANVQFENSNLILRCPLAEPGCYDRAVRASTNTGVAAKADAFVDGRQAVRVRAAKSLRQTGSDCWAVSTTAAPLRIHPRYDIPPEAALLRH